MGLGLQGGLFRLFLLLHILCAAVGFGALAFNGLIRARARRLGGDAELLVLEENAFVTGIAEFFIYAVLILGLLVALTSQNTWDLSQSWLSLAMLLYLIELGLLHAVIHRADREYQSLMGQVNARDPGDGDEQPAPPEQLQQLERLEQRIRLGWAGFDVIFVIILYLMVFTPGHVRIS